MSQRFPAEGSVQSSQSQLNPVLQAALASLDIQLEDELARYRRQRAKRGTPALRSTAPRSPKSLDLIAISAVGERTHPTPPPRTPSVAESRIADPWLAEPGTSAQLAIASEGNLAPSSSSLAHPPTPDTYSLLDPRTDGGPDDYLESSEELLKSLAEEEAEVETQQSFLNHLLTPLGIGSLLLLLLASTTFGYVIMNPQSLNPLARSPKSSQEKAGGSAPTGLADASPGGVTSDSVDLADSPFPSLDLNNLSMAKPDADRVAKPSQSPQGTKPEGTPLTATIERPAPKKPVARRSTSAAPAPAAGATSNQPEPVRASAPVREPAPAPRAAAPAPRTTTPADPTTRAAAPAPAPAQSSPSASAYRYKVVIPYDSDRTLQQARQTVPDAYVKNFSDGAQIQMGAFTSEVEARQRVEQLQQQGIPAQVYQP